MPGPVSEENGDNDADLDLEERKWTWLRWQKVAKGLKSSGGAGPLKTW